VAKSSGRTTDDLRELDPVPVGRAGVTRKNQQYG
jgi:hypothetical protein